MVHQRQRSAGAGGDAPKGALHLAALLLALLLPSPIEQSSAASASVSEAFVHPRGFRTARPASPSFVSPANGEVTNGANGDVIVTEGDDGPADPPSAELWAVETIKRVVPLSPNGDDDDDLPLNPLALKPNVPSAWFVTSNEAVAARVEVDADLTVTSTRSSVTDRAAAAFTLAGPRMELAFEPEGLRAAVVTCGGLCPGLNTVVREIAMCLRRQYGVSDVYGIPGGYRGLLEPTKWIDLDYDYINDIHNVGGSVLGTSRGGHDTAGIVDALEAEDIDILFIVGGDGTVRGAMKVAEEVEKRGLRKSVAVVPKTIDNDIPLVDRTFGFETAVEEARRAIDAADVEASGFPKGLGIVKLMGRHSGFIAMHASLGARVSDLCLVPEVPFYLDGPGGIVDHLYQRLLEHDKAIVVVAEGAGQDNLAADGEASDVQKDASGNVLLDDIGPWLCKRLKSKIDAKLVEEFGTDTDKVSLKYIDPSYMVRGVPSNSADNVYCTQLAHNAVHGALAGYTSFLVGLINTRPCYVPLRLVADRRNVLDAAHHSVWANVVFDTGQPKFEVDSEMCDISDIDLTTASGGCMASGA